MWLLSVPEPWLLGHTACCGQILPVVPDWRHFPPESPTLASRVRCTETLLLQSLGLRQIPWGESHPGSLAAAPQQPSELLVRNVCPGLGAYHLCPSERMQLSCTERRCCKRGRQTEKLVRDNPSLVVTQALSSSSRKPKQAHSWYCPGRQGHHCPMQQWKVPVTASHCRRKPGTEPLDSRGW